MIERRLLKAACLLPLVGYCFVVVAPWIAAIGGWTVVGAGIILAAAVLPLSRRYRFDRIAPSVILGGLPGAFYLLAQSGAISVSSGTLSGLLELSVGTILISPLVAAAWMFVEEEGIGWQIFSFQLLLVDLVLLLVLVGTFSSLSSINASTVATNLRTLLVTQFRGVIELAQGSYVPSDLPLSQFPQPAVVPLAALALFGTLSPLLRPITVSGAQLPLTESNDRASLSASNQALLARHPELLSNLQRGPQVHRPPARAFPGATPLIVAALAIVLLTWISYSFGILVLLALSLSAVGVALGVYLVQLPRRYRAGPQRQSTASPAPPTLPHKIPNSP